MTYQTTSYIISISANGLCASVAAFKIIFIAFSRKKGLSQVQGQ